MTKTTQKLSLLANLTTASLTLHVSQNLQFVGELLIEVILYLEQFVIFVHFASDTNTTQKETR